MSAEEVLHVKLEYLKIYYWDKDGNKRCGEDYSSFVIGGSKFYVVY